MTREHEVQPRRLGRRSIMKAAGASLVLGAAEIRADQRQSTQTFGCTGLPRLGAAKPKPKDQTFLSDEGFKNTTLDGKKGFQVKLRVDYYRCMHLEEIESFSVKVDGKDVSPEDMVFILEDRRYKVAELQNT